MQSALQCVAVRRQRLCLHTPSTHTHTKWSLCNTLQRAATCCNTLQHTAVRTTCTCAQEVIVGMQAVNFGVERMLQCVAVCCSVLQCVAVCYSVLHRNYFSTTRGNSRHASHQPRCRECVAACCSVLQRAAACCRVLQRVAVCCTLSLWATSSRTLSGLT